MKIKNVSSANWTLQSTLEVIKRHRNDLINDFLTYPRLLNYLAKRYQRYELTGAKFEFIRKDLKQLFDSPLNKRHYISLIKQVHNNHITPITYEHENLFYKELDKVLTRYIA